MTIAPGESVATEEAPLDLATQGAVAIQGRSPWQIVWGRLKRDKVTMVALFASTLALVVAALVPALKALGWIDPISNHPDLVQGIGSMPEGPLGGVSSQHWFGVEPGTGRDLFSLILAGITTSLTVAVLATLFAVVLGTTLGIIAGFSRGPGRLVHQPVHRPGAELPRHPHAAVPRAGDHGLPLAAVMGMGDAEPGPKIAFMVIVLGFFGFPFFARIIRGQVLLAARARVRRGGALPGRPAVPDLLQGAAARTCGHRSWSTRPS